MKTILSLLSIFIASSASALSIPVKCDVELWQTGEKNVVVLSKKSTFANIKESLGRFGGYEFEAQVGTINGQKVPTSFHMSVRPPDSNTVFVSHGSLAGEDKEMETTVRMSSDVALKFTCAQAVD